MVFQLSVGNLSRQALAARSPPRNGPIFVLAQVSSMKTSRPSDQCGPGGSSTARACGRRRDGFAPSTVFFEAEALSRR